MRMYKLPETVLSLKGNAAQFLNGLSSNTLDAPLNAFLNQHGRIIATFRQKKLSDEEMLISVPSVVVDHLLKHLERYAKLSRVQVIPASHKTFIDLDTAQVVWGQQEHANSVSEEEFTAFRLKHQMPLMGIDYQPDEFVLNVHEYHYVSYTKGCFMGQEPVAKVHNRSHPSRQLIVAFEDECPSDIAVKMTSKVLDSASGRVQGFVFSPLPPGK